MFTDVAVSQDITAAFRAQQGERRGAAVSGGSDVDLEVLVLTAGSWPVTQAPSPLVCPQVRPPRHKLGRHRVSAVVDHTVARCASGLDGR